MVSVHEQTDCAKGTPSELRYARKEEVHKNKQIASAPSFLANASCRPGRRALRKERFFELI